VNNPYEKTICKPENIYGACFAGVADYRADNKDNLQVGALVAFRITAGEPLSRCFVELDDCGDLGGTVEFRFSDASILLAPERK